MADAAGGVKQTTLDITGAKIEVKLENALQC